MTLYSSGQYQKTIPSFTIKHVISSIEDFKKVVGSTDYCFASFRDGYSQSGMFYKSHRASEDWLHSDALYADFDDGFSIEEFRVLFSNYEYYLTTSKSHQILKHGKVCDRFHAVFPISQIDDIQKHKTYLQILHKYFLKMKHLDKNCIDSTRAFYANKNTEVFYNPGKRIDVVISKLYEKMPKPKPKPEPTISSAYNKMILNKIDKAYNYGWFKEYHSWLNLGMALHKAGFDLSVWQKYCDTNKDKEIAEYKWKGFGNGSLGMNFLLDICKKIK